MKTLRCWSQVVDPLNLWQAWREFSGGKRRRPNVAAFDLDAPVHLLRLAEDLAQGRYRPGGYRLLRIADPKRRVVSAAPVRDRVVHHAIHRVIAPWWNRSFSEQSYACLAGRGSHRAVLRFRSELRRYRYVMQLDMRRYFYSIDRAVLHALLVRRLPEPELGGLLEVILDSGASLYRDPALVGWLGWDAPPPPGKGLPIGNLTSQWWGNVYLDGLDHHVQRVLRLPSAQRYMDDVALFADDAGTLDRAREAIATWLHDERGLVLKDPAAPPRPTTGWHLYLGYRVSRAGTEPGPRMRSRVRQHVDGKDPAALRAAVAAMAAAWTVG